MAQGSPPKTDTPTRPGAPLRVLLADDDRLILATLSEGLRAAVYETIEATTGSMALALSATAAPDIAFLDYDMPDISGIEIARKLGEADAFPFVFLSAYGDASIVKAATDAGAMAYLVKPIDPSQLIPMIQTAIQRFAEMRRLRRDSASLASALQATRETNIVVGLLMARLHMSDKEAYNRLRQFARSRNRKVSDVASDIVAATGAVHSVFSEIASMTADQA